MKTQLQSFVLILQTWSCALVGRVHATWVTRSTEGTHKDLAH